VTGARYRKIVIDGVPVVATPAEIDITSSDELRSALLRASADSPDTLVVDMSRTQFCDSSGLHTLVAAHKRARAEGREILLVIPDTPVLRVFTITGMDRVIPTFTTLDEALAQPATPVHAHSRQPAEGDAHAEKQPVRPVTS
jgi:anti-sigma B factor antagonist